MVKNKRTCKHMRINLLGSEETGLRAAVCEDCGSRLTRRRGEQGEYIYGVLPGAE